MGQAPSLAETIGVALVVAASAIAVGTRSE